MADKKPSTVVTVRSKIETAEVRAQIAKVLPAHMDVDKVVTGVRLAVAQNPDLAKCNPESVVFAVMAACQLGLEINSPLQHAWLIPYGTECTLQIGYRGYQDLARRGGEVSHVEARVVYEGDEFDYSLGTDPKIVHRPKGEFAASKLTHAYAIAFPKAGGPPIFDVLTREDVERAQKSSRMANGPAWSKHTAEMWRKTAVRRLAKYLPLSPELAAAIEMDIRGDTGEIGAPIQGIDSPARLNAAVANKTAAQLDDLRKTIGAGVDTTGGRVPGVQVEPVPASGEQPAW